MGHRGRKGRDFNEWLQDFILYQKNGYVPNEFQTPEGRCLGEWYTKVKSGRHKITEEQRAILTAHHFDWQYHKIRRPFEAWFQDFLKYNQNGLVSMNFVTPEGNKLGIWVSNVRQGKIKLTEEQKDCLNQHGFCWNARKKQRK